MLTKTLLIGEQMSKKRANIKGTDIHCDCEDLQKSTIPDISLESQLPSNTTSFGFCARSFSKSYAISLR